MKIRVQIILIICLAISTLVCAFLWQSEKNSKDDLLLLAQASANDAYADFVKYQENGHESNYWSGVASFRTFEQAYYLLTENTNKTTNYTFCNEVFGSLVIHPEKCQDHMEDIIATMYILANDVEDENGHLKMSGLRNTLEHD